jgi:hypothetical protein
VRTAEEASFPLQVALLKVHDRLIEAEENTQGLMTRMLVCHTQAGCIIGKYVPPGPTPQHSLDRQAPPALQLLSVA